MAVVVRQMELIAEFKDRSDMKKNRKNKKHVSNLPIIYTNECLFVTTTHLGVRAFERSDVNMSVLVNTHAFICIQQYDSESVNLHIYKVLYQLMLIVFVLFR